MSSQPSDTPVPPRTHTCQTIRHLPCAACAAETHAAHRHFMLDALVDAPSPTSTVVWASASAAFLGKAPQRIDDLLTLLEQRGDVQLALRGLRALRDEARRLIADAASA